MIVLIFLRGYMVFLAPRNTWQLYFYLLIQWEIDTTVEFSIAVHILKFVLSFKT